MRLLSVDWDYFFVDPIGAPPATLPVFIQGKCDVEETLFKTWLARAEMYLGPAEALPQTSGEESGFWRRFTFTSGCALFLVEHHRHAAHHDVREGISEVWNFDAHHDAGGYGDVPADEYDDGNWLMAYGGEVDRHVRYPSWKTSVFDDEPAPLIEVDRQFDDGSHISHPFDRVFVCRSGQWVPPWLDQAYQEFVGACPVKKVTSGSLQNREKTWERVKAELAKRRRGLS